MVLPTPLGLDEGHDGPLPPTRKETSPRERPPVGQVVLQVRGFEVTHGTGSSSGSGRAPGQTLSSCVPACSARDRDHRRGARAGNAVRRVGGTHEPRRRPHRRDARPAPSATVSCGWTSGCSRPSPPAHLARRRPPAAPVEPRCRPRDVVARRGRRPGRVAHSQGASRGRPGDRLAGSGLADDQHHRQALGAPDPPGTGPGAAGPAAEAAADHDVLPVGACGLGRRVRDRRGAGVPGVGCGGGPGGRSGRPVPVYTGVHFPSDVLAGAALGVGPRSPCGPWCRPAPSAPSRPGRAPRCPRCPAARDWVVVANVGSGTSDRVRALCDALPDAEVVECEPGDVRAELEKAAGHARVLGVCGGDGTVNAAAEIAPPPRAAARGAAGRHAQPLRLRPGRGGRTGSVRGAGGGARGCGWTWAGSPRAGRGGVFLNTFSLGVYPELVHERERWSSRIGGWPAGVLAAGAGAARRPASAGGRGARPQAPAVDAVRGQRHLPPPGARLGASTRPGGRTVGRAGGARGRFGRPCGCCPRPLAGPLTRSPAHAAVQVPRLRLSGVAPGTLMAFDGELTETEGDLTLEKLPEALTVYRPLPGGGLLS